MYSSTTARIATPSFISPNIPLTKGTRQGCPLSLLLFNIAIEPLSRFLNSKLGVSGIPIGDQVLQSAFYILLFSTSPSSDIPLLRELFSTFCKCTGLRINFDKSEILVLNPRVAGFWFGSSVLLVASHHITYLGVKIARDPSSLYSLNYSQNCAGAGSLGRPPPFALWEMSLISNGFFPKISISFTIAPTTIETC